jgi:hypothetical protein
MHTQRQTGITEMTNRVKNGKEKAEDFCYSHRISDNLVEKENGRLVL